MKTPSGVYWFVDKDVKTGMEYEYRVVVYCKNPIYGTSKATPGMPPVLASKPATSSTAGVVFPSITKWYFQGGFVSQDAQTGTFRVRRFVGGRSGFSSAEINEALADFMRPEGEPKRPTKKPAADENAGGIWVQQNFQVRPGEEIGRKAVVDVSGQPREVDFATGCQLVSISDEVSVVESVRERLVPGKDAPKTVQDVQRIVNAVKLRCAYINPQGGLDARWQENAPALDKEMMP